MISKNPKYKSTDMIAAVNDSQFQNTDSVNNFRVTNEIMILKEEVDPNQWKDVIPDESIGPWAKINGP